VTRARALLALLVAAVACGRGGEADPRPDVLLITVDTLRADRFGFTGHAAARTPNIDRLAREGAVFTDAITPVPRTTQSVASIFTSRYPSQHGVKQIGERLPERAITLAEILRQAGYWTGAVSANGVASQEQGLEQGFDHFTDSQTLKQRYGLRGKIHGPTPEVGRAEATTRESLLLLERGSAPRLLWVHYMDPHFVYNPPAPFNQVVDWRRFRFYLERRRFRSPRVATFFDLHGLSSKALPEVSALYDAEIAYTDHWIGRLLGALQRDTLVLFTSDHGESLGEHGYYFEHGDFVYQVSMAIPLIVWWPGSIAAGLRIEDPVSALDILPTLLGLLDQAPPPETAFVGVDLSPRLRVDGKGVPAPGRMLFGESGASFLAGNPLREKDGERWTMLRKGRWKLIRIPGASGVRWELYDLEADPGESADLAASEAERVDALRGPLDAWTRELGTAGAPVEVEPGLETKLRELGYVE
jgi:arylsulfatase A-like enzyme